MTAALATQLSASLAWLFQDAQGLTTITDAARLDYDAQLSDGAGDGQADALWHDVRTIAGGANDDLQLSALTQTVFHSAVSVPFAAVKALLIVNLATDATAELLVGGAPTHAWGAPFGAATNQVRVAAESCLLLVNKHAGWPVTAGSTDVLRVANPSASSIDYKVVLVGVRG